MFSSCNEVQELSPNRNFEKETELFSKMTTAGFDLATSSLASNLSSTGKSEMTLNQRQLVKDILNGMNGQFLETNEEAIGEVSGNYGDIRLSGQFVNGKTMSTVDLGSLGHYSDSQIALAQPFVDKLLSTEDVNSYRFDAISFQESVVASSLTDDEKLELLVLSTSVVAFANFLENGGIERIQAIIANELEANGIPNGKTMGCSIDTRGVLADAVVGLVAGATYGGYVGATTGTFTIPGILTVAGGVAGAAAGGAFGFVTGALEGIASNLLQTCGR